MKHSLKITLLLISLFFITQLVGLLTTSRHIQVIPGVVEGTVEVFHPDTVLGPPPQIENKSGSFIYIVFGVLIGTALLFLFIKLGVTSLWKYWFLLSVIITLTVSFGVYVPAYIAAGMAIVLGIWKVYKPNVIVHNFTEIFIYTGIVIIFLPILNLFSASIMLVLISIYDAIAVWKSKHMVTMAKFQTQSKVFAGLLIPYEKRVSMGKAVPAKGETVSSERSKNAILGGGDIAFPLLFSSTVMEYLIVEKGFIKATALGLGGIVAVGATVALFLLLIKAKEDRFYPAMPFISAGCFVGFGIIWLLFL